MACIDYTKKRQIKRKIGIIATLNIFAGSSSGRTMVSGTINLGSNPSPATKFNL